VSTFHNGVHICELVFVSSASSSFSGVGLKENGGRLAGVGGDRVSHWEVKSRYACLKKGANGPTLDLT